MQFGQMSQFFTRCSERHLRIRFRHAKVGKNGKGKTREKSSGELKELSEKAIGRGNDSICGCYGVSWRERLWNEGVVCGVSGVRRDIK